MKRGDIKEVLKNIGPQAMNKEMVRAIGHRYNSKFSGFRGLFHSRHDVANILVAFSGRLKSNDAATGYEAAWLFLADQLQGLKDSAGWLAETIVECAEMAFNRIIPTSEVIAGNTAQVKCNQQHNAARKIRSCLKSYMEKQQKSKDESLNAGL